MSVYLGHDSVRVKLNEKTYRLIAGQKLVIISLLSSDGFTLMDKNNTILITKEVE